MKKLVLLLVISLGLSVANAESVCNSYSTKDYISVKFVGQMSQFATGDYKQEKYWDELIMRYYTSEIKKSDKETICIYMVTTRQGYLNTQLTPQEIERFERFLIEKADESNYKIYENYKDSYLKALKFFKYYNKLDILYSKKDIRTGIIKYANPDSLGMVASWLEVYENEATIAIKRFVYGKDMGDYLPDALLGRGYNFTYPRSIKELKEMNNQDAKNIAKWAESKIKEAKK